MNFFKVRGCFRMPNKWYVKPKLQIYLCMGSAQEESGFDLKFC